ncbi:hypothetical protein DIURU_002536 [Diutina rugosa]|uniref:Pheromone-processing carboxypeptidase KEX1 n=1 Tax=Diutina rugosa TaxID=5481 RepID=A0A642UUJ2_DIURU|nr:uncharacterized protein DIURU_002536 [Diutina rugosa]KAA8903249.1 hypothetical protein DIURU_002536 [Diutina rugosa]
MLVRLLAVIYTACVAVAAPGYLIPRTASDLQHPYVVSDLPGLAANVPADAVPEMHAGHVDVGEGTKYFFWRFADSQRLPENQNRTMFWLNGGPGCSSMDGALLECGPFRIDDSQSVTHNNGSWHRLMDMVYVDQPAGTGFSDVDGQSYAQNHFDIGTVFIQFMLRYFELFPEARDHSIYFGGESYAGQYIPFVLKAILDYNRDHPDQPFNVKGAAIGNGWFSPNEQSLWYIPFYRKAGLLDETNPHLAELLQQHQKCQKIVDDIDRKWDDPDVNPVETDSSICENILSLLNKYTLDTDAPTNEQCINVYDYTLRDSPGSCGMRWPLELKYVTPFLRRDDVIEALHVTDAHDWKECKGGQLSRQLNTRNSKPAVHLLPEIAKEIPLVLFNGNLDIICNYLGQESFLNKLTWDNQRGFDEGHQDWYHNGDVHGYMKSRSNISSLVIYNASHMVPYDKPEVSRAVIDILVGNFDNHDDKLETFPIGVRQAKLAENKPEEKPEDKPEEDKPEDEEKPQETEAVETPTETNTAPPAEESGSSSTHTTSGFTRVVEVVVVLVLLWGVYVLFVSYRSRPQSIIKPPGASQKKKNVQWADQLRQFQGDDDNDDDYDGQVASSSSPPAKGFLAKARDKLTGKPANNTYAVVPNDLELGDHEGLADADDFVIGDEDEDHDRPMR